MNDIDKLFPNSEDKWTFLLSAGFSLALQLSAYRSAYKKNWGAAIWKTLVAQETSRNLARIARKRKQQSSLNLTEKPFAWYN